MVDLNFVISRLANFFKQVVLCLCFSHVSRASIHNITILSFKRNWKKLISWWTQRLKNNQHVIIFKIRWNKLYNILNFKTYKKNKFKNAINIRDSHILFQNNTSSNNPIKATSKREFSFLLLSVLLLVPHFSFLLIVANILYAYWNINT